MGRKADGPPSGRVGHGYTEAKEAGVPWELVRPKSDSENLKDQETKRQADADFNKRLDKLKKYHPNPMARALQLGREGVKNEEIIKVLEREAEAQKRKRDLPSKAAKEGKNSN